MGHLWPWLFLAGLGAACVDEEPVLTGIPQAPLLSEAPEEPKIEPNAKARYVKADTVYVDVRYLGGKPFHQVRDVLSEQLGTLQKRSIDDGKQGELLEYQRGSIRVIKKAVAMLKIPLPAPLRRTEALESLGFPPYVGGYTIFHREYRLHHEWGFRRIRMKREDRRSERVIEIEAWRWLPGERELGR